MKSIAAGPLRGRGGEGPGGCLRGIGGGGGLNIFFRGRNSHQALLVSRSSLTSNLHDVEAQKSTHSFIPGRRRFRCWTTECRIPIPEKRSRNQNRRLRPLDTTKKTSRYQKRCTLASSSCIKPFLSAGSINHAMWSSSAKACQKKAKNYVTTWRPQTFETLGVQSSAFQKCPQYCWEFHDQLWEALSGTNSEKRGVPSRTGGEIILEMLWKPQMPWIIGLGASQPYSRGVFQETLWERFRGLSGNFPEFLPGSTSRTGGMAQPFFVN